MKERPILFSGPMVRAILDGRKNQTRRVVKPQPALAPGFTFEVPGPLSGRAIPVCWDCNAHGVSNDSPYPQLWLTDDAVNCPYGQPGDRLWVRETWCQKFDDNDMPVYNAEGNLDASCCWYKATNPEIVLCPGLEMPLRTDGRERSPWSPSIHMPRWASRITLEVTGVRVERVREISFADCRAEGCDPAFTEFVADCDERDHFDDAGNPVCDGHHRGEKWHFYRIWDSINAARGYGWDANPWVWVVEFEKIGGAS